MIDNYYPPTMSKLKNNTKNKERGHQYVHANLLRPGITHNGNTNKNKNNTTTEDDDDVNSHPLIIKLFPFTTILTLIMLLLIHSDFFASNDDGTDVITSRILLQDNVVLCADQSYSTLTELTYTYYLETSEGTSVDETIKSLEYEIQEHLADSLLFCNLPDGDGDSDGAGAGAGVGNDYSGSGNSGSGNSGSGNGNGNGGVRKKRRNRESFKKSRQLQTIINKDYASANSYSHGDDWDLVDEFGLKIVGITSAPDDEPSTKSSCVAREGKECTVVRGALALYLEPDADLKTIRYAARRAIRDSMLNDLYVEPRIEGLKAVKYVAPAIYNPSDTFDNEVDGGYTDGTDPFGHNKSVNSGLSRLEIVVVATLISTVVGLIGSFILFKKVFSKQNCMAGCDGTGIDREYIEQCNVGINPVVDQDNDSDSSRSGSKGGGWNMNSVMNTSGVLSSIDENSMPPSDASYYSNASTAFSANKSIALRSVSSLHSEQTMVMTNRGRNRTPTFGGIIDKENAPPPPPSDSSVIT